MLLIFTRKYSINCFFHIIFFICFLTGLAEKTAAQYQVHKQANASQIVIQPQNSSIDCYSNTFFAVTAAGSGLKYKWQECFYYGGDWHELSPGGMATGINTDTLHLTQVIADMDNYLYRVIVTDISGIPDTSITVSLTVTPYITTVSPPSAEICLGGSEIFTMGRASPYLWFDIFSPVYGVPIPDNDPSAPFVDSMIINDTVLSSSSFSYCGGIDVVINMNHPRASDMVIVLQAPNGNILNLSYLLSSTASNNPTSEFSHTVFSYRGTEAIGSANYFINADFAPDGVINPPPGYPPAGPVGLIPNVTNVQDLLLPSVKGKWKLAMYDARTGEQGIFYSWRLQFEWYVGTAGTWGTNNQNTILPYAGQVGGVGFNAATITPVDTTDYFAIATNHYCPIGTVPAIIPITVNYRVDNIIPPSDTTVCENNPIQFTVSATGTALTYQWQVSTDGGATFNDIGGAVDDTLSLTAVTASMNHYLYRVKITGVCTNPGIFCNPVMLTVNAAAAVTSQPANATACIGGSAIFSIAGNNISTYQWQTSTDGIVYTNIPGANASSVLVSSITASMNNYHYRVVVGNSCSPGLLSSDAILTIGGNATISTQPVPAEVCEGSQASFSASVINGISFQWQVSTDGGNNYTNIPGATGNTLNINPVPVTMNNYLYKLIITDCGGITSSTIPVSLTVLPAPVILSQPADAAACSGLDVIFTANATGTGYQWQVSTNAGASFNDIPGENNATLLLHAISASMNNNLYRTVASGIATCNSIASQPALLTVYTLASVTISANPSSQIPEGSQVVLTATANPPANTFNWYHNNMPVPSVTGNTIPVNYDEAGEYYAIATDIHGCSKESNHILLTDSVGKFTFITPNPNDGAFTVRYVNYENSATRYIVIWDSKGAKVYQGDFTVTGFDGKININLRYLSAGSYLLQLYDKNKKRLKAGKFVVL